MKRERIPGFIILFCLFISSGVSAQEQKDTGKKKDKAEKAEKVLSVKFSLDVEDANGRRITNLNKDDISVYEDEVKQQIETFSYDPGPVSLGIMLDTSGSMRPYIKTVIQVAIALIRQMRPEDEALLGQFKAEPELVQDFTQDKNQLEKSLSELYLSGGSSLFDALIATGNHMQKNSKNHHKVLVMVTDGVEKNSRYKFDKAIKEIEGGSPQIYILVLPYMGEEKPPEKSLEKSKEWLTYMAESTGGEVLNLNSLADLSAAFSQLVTRIWSPYLIGYKPGNQDKGSGPRKVRIEIKEKDHLPLTVYARKGYSVPKLSKQ